MVVTKEGTWRRVWGVVWRTGLLTALASLWWVVGLQVEAGFGVNVLKYTETVQATSSASLASEVLRGLGYWYFYGSDRVGPWTQSSVAYTQNLWLIGASFAVPILAFVAAVLVRWRQRTYFVLMIVVGMVLSVGAHPFSHPSSVGSLLKSFMVDTTAGLAMRSTDRASPVVLLSMALLLGAGISALAARTRRTGLIVTVGALGIVAAATVPLWTGAIIATGFTQPAQPPNYVKEAVAKLDSVRTSTRVYALPGNNFAAYRWGDTIDTVYPGFLQRPFVTHEQQIMGSLPTADLLNAVDTPLQEGTEDWNALAPMAALMSAGDVLVQYDQQYERYNTPYPLLLASDLATTPPGLSDPVSYGKPTPNISDFSTLDEVSLGLPPNQTWPNPLVSYTVKNPRPIIRGESISNPLIVDGDATGIVNAAGVGMLADNPTILYAGTLDTDPTLKKATLSKPADLVVTDTNRKQGFLWNSLQENTGYTETKSQGPDKQNPSNEPINLFPKAPADAQTTTAFKNISSVSASSYANSVTYFPEDRPSAAIDGLTATAWLDNSFTTPIGQWWQVTMDHPTTTNTVTLVQPQTGNPNRWITRATLTFDGKDPVTVNLGAVSRTANGQQITFSTRMFKTLRIRVDAFGGSDAFVGASAIGFAEVDIPGLQTAGETVVLPQDLLRATGAASINDSLTFLLNRLRSSGTPPRSDTEPFLSRQIWLPTSRMFNLTGEARISSLVPDDAIDDLVGQPDAAEGGITAYSSGRLPGNLEDGAIATLDGNPQTVWEPGLGANSQPGAWLQYDLPSPVTFDQLNLQIVADGEHSVPTSVTVSTENGSRYVKLPAIANGRTPGSVVNVPVSFPVLTGQDIKVTFTTVRLVNTVNYYAQTPSALPIAIADVGIPQLTLPGAPEIQAPPTPSSIPSPCQSNLLFIDGNPVSISISGSTQTALAGNALSVSLCGFDAGGITLGPGTHTITAAYGNARGSDGQAINGFNIDELALSSAPGGGPKASPPGATLATSVSPPPTESAPQVHVISQTATTIHVRVTGAKKPFDFVLGQSVDSGWKATTSTGTNLGRSFLIDGFANGWTVTAADLTRVGPGGSFDVTLRFTPQTQVDLALLISGLTILLCLLLAYLPVRWRRRIRRYLRATARRLRGKEPETVTAVEQIDESSWSVRAPSLWSPFHVGKARTSWMLSIAVAVLTGVVGALIAAPLTGLVAGVATLVALVVPRIRGLLGIAAVALMIASGTYVVVHQAQIHAIPGGNWTSYFGPAGSVAWAAVVFLGADAVVEITRRLMTRHTATEPDTGPNEDTIGETDPTDDADSGSQDVHQAPRPHETSST